MLIHRLESPFVVIPQHTHYYDATNYVSGDTRVFDKRTYGYRKAHSLRIRTIEDWYRSFLTVEQMLELHLTGTVAPTTHVYFWAEEHGPTLLWGCLLTQRPILSGVSARLWQATQPLVLPQDTATFRLAELALDQESLQWDPTPEVPYSTLQESL